MCWWAQRPIWPFCGSVDGSGCGILSLAYNWGPGNVRRLMEANGGWLDVPASRRDYAVSIVLQADLHGLVQTMPDGVTAPVREMKVSVDYYDYLDDLLASAIPVTPTTPRSVRRRAN